MFGKGPRKSLRTPKPGPLRNTLEWQVGREQPVAGIVESFVAYIGHGGAPRQTPVCAQVMPAADPCIVRKRVDRDALCGVEVHPMSQACEQVRLWFASAAPKFRP